jgi:Ca2+-transporting ATPase
MQLPPRPPKENLFAGGLISRILFAGIMMTAASLFIQWWAIKRDYSINSQQTMVFTTLCLVQLGNALSVRARFESIFSKRLFKNIGMWIAIIATLILQALIVFVPALGKIFKTTALDWDQFMMIGLVAFGSLVLIELGKVFWKAWFKN